jgi:1-deoxy-D-xylulose-5-phosphate reductoisomerase
MGPKITVDSATLMNKALEMIEAHYLFGLDAEKIKVVIHPQSIVHSMVEYVDGSVMAQMSLPDMRLPVQYALTYPERMDGLGRELDLSRISALDFEEPDTGKFASIRLAYEAIRRGGLACVALNAGNEAAVGLFLEGRITFDRIFTLVEKVLSGFKKTGMPEDLTGELGQIMYADAWARKEILKCLC